MLSWEMTSKTFFAYPDLIIGTLKGSTDQCFNFSAQSQHFTAVRLDPIFLIFLYGQQSMSTERADIHFI